MKSRGRICVVLGASLALGLSGVAVAATVTPPAGTPNLAAMVLQPSDLAAGAVVGTEGYVTPAKAFSAEYDSSFTSAETPDGVSYDQLADGVSIAPSASQASGFFTAEAAFFDSKKGHKLLDKGIIASAGKKAHLKASNIKYKAGGSVGVGGDSFLESIGVSTKHASIHEDVVLFDQGTIYALLVVIAKPDEKLPTSDATALATAIDSHINSVMASSGSTGSTGTS